MSTFEDMQILAAWMDATRHRIYDTKLVVPTQEQWDFIVDGGYNMDGFIKGWELNETSNVESVGAQNVY